MCTKLQVILFSYQSTRVHDLKSVPLRDTLRMSRALVVDREPQHAGADQTRHAVEEQSRRTQGLHGMFPEASDFKKEMKNMHKLKVFTCRCRMRYSQAIA